MSRSAVVLGAGIVGLTTARALVAAGWTVRVVTERPPAETVSAVAGASFKPHAVGESALTSEVLRVSKAALDRLWESGEAEALQVRRGAHREVRLSADADMSHLALMQDVRHATDDRWPVDVTYSTYLFDPARTLAALVQALEGTGVELETGRRVDSLAELAAGSDAPDLIVNCAGLGAGRLAGDDSLLAVKGQVVSVARGPQHAGLTSYSIAGFYLYVRADDLLLGGTVEWGAPPGNDAGTVERILAGHGLLHPAFRQVPEHRPMWGMRPFRPDGVRVGPGEPVGRTAVLHNYGHGGSGWTLALGCADLVAVHAAAVAH